MENYRTLKRLVKNDKHISWVYEQLLETYSHGVSSSAKESSTNEEFLKLEPSNITSTEKTKRNNYETSRPLTEEEKYHLLLEAIKKVFIEVPAFQQSAVKYFSELANSDIEIEFSQSEEIYDDLIEETNIIRENKEDNLQFENNYKKFIESIGERSD